MTSLRLLALLTAALPLTALGVWALAADAPKPDRAKAQKLQQDGNFKDAYDQFARLALDPADTDAAGDLDAGLQCLRRLARQDEMDAFREKVVALHAGDWRALWTAAQSLVFHGEDLTGTIIAGEFHRGRQRGGGRYVDPYERDRVHALQLMQQAMPLLKAETNKQQAGAFWLDLNKMLAHSRYGEDSWRLQYLTDLAKLPDYEDAPRYWYGRQSRGAPVNADGTPVYHYLPKSWDAAKTDGERWRWAQMQAIEYDPARTGEVRFAWAQFLRNQFGVQTMAYYGRAFGGVDEDDTKKNESGPYAVSTLTDDETIARLASGIKRFKLPDEFNYIRIFQDIAADKAHGYGEQALGWLATVYEDRQQYPKAADTWRRVIREYGPQNQNQQRLDQIVKNWGMFEPVLTQTAGQGAKVDFRFRNASKVSLTAHEIDIPKLIADLKDYLKSNPRNLEWERTNIESIGWQLVQNKAGKYLGAQVAKWDVELKPRPSHFDRRTTLATPLQKAGAYYVTASVEGGNTSSIVLWIADSAIVKKQLDQASYYYVADAVSGAPVPKANVEFFGYQQKWIQEDAKRGTGHQEIATTDFAEFADADGQLILNQQRQPGNFQYLVIATTPANQGQRLAYLGFTGVWYGNYYDQEYKQDKVFVMTDRPVYRPGQGVKFKFWVNHAQYDREGKSPFAGSSFTVRINNPKGEKVLEKVFTADDYGGFDGVFDLPKDAILGAYALQIPGKGGGSFRVEEYKKPEFEVTVEAPKEPIMLGDKITATIEAKYLFGAPVTEAKVKYKVQRTSYAAHWYPIGRWDWFYGPGYWWFGCDYAWYPGWTEWGCMRPAPWWMWGGGGGFGGRRGFRGWGPQEQPEIVAESEVPVGADGKVKVEIDTGVAKALQGDTDHAYEITAEVTDQSRRTIVGTGQVLAARKPFKVYAWVNRGHFQVGDVVHASFSAQTLDNKPVQGKGELRLLKITYDKDQKPVEAAVQKWDLNTNEEGSAQQQLKAAEAGQYRLSYTLTDAKDHKVEGGYVFLVRGPGFDGSEFRFNDLELVTDKREYQPGAKVELVVNTNRPASTVLLFVRPVNGICLPPKLLRLKGKSVEEDIEIVKKDMPNFFVEALTISGGKVYSEMREVIVPPESRVLDVTVTPAAEKVKPGQKTRVQVKLLDSDGKPYVGSTVIAMYDKALEYISGGSNVPAIRDFFWKWRRHHNPQYETSLNRGGGNLTRPGDVAMGFLGVFGSLTADQEQAGAAKGKQMDLSEGMVARRGVGGGLRAMDAASGPPAPMAAAAPASLAANGAMADKPGGGFGGAGGAGPGAESQNMVEPVIRSNFADTALWVAALSTNQNGIAEVDLTMPENLTTWKTRVWAMGDGARCGSGDADVITTKNLILRLQAPRFFTQKDEVVLSANVHNFLKARKTVRVELELGDNGVFDGVATAGGKDWALSKTQVLDPGGQRGAYLANTQTIEIAPDAEQRVDWRVKVAQPGTAIVRMKALTDEESDAMEMKFPAYIHGLLKTESFSGAIRPDKESGAITIKVPAERLPEQSVLEVRYSPTLAGAMVDALPYLVDYPYGCTEQTLNRFLPTVLTQKTLLKMGLDLKDIQKKRTNLNAQEIGDDAKRAADYQRMRDAQGHPNNPRNPVFDEAEVADMVQAGLEKLTAMQNSDGGWGWFSGWGEFSWPHTTALVVHGLQLARDNDVALVPGVLDRGVAWLKRYQDEQVRRLKLPKDDPHHKEHADDLDSFVYMVLVDAKPRVDNAEMRDFLYRDRNELAVYTKAMFGLALHKLGDLEKRDMLIRNVEQYLVQDDENQSAYLKLPASNWWWCWHGSEYEAQAYYLKLLALTDPKSEKASRLVKYLVNNRKHATYWNSTRDTAIVVEALADYLKASGEDAPNLTVTVLVDGKQAKQVKIDKANLFSFDNRFALLGPEVTTGEHRVELRKEGTGPLYFNAYLTNFTLEDPIAKAGLEIKVQRKVYKLVREDKTIKAEGSRGQVLDQKVEKYRRELVPGPFDDVNGRFPVLKSGDLLEVELEIESKNDYEYIMFEDLKAAGCEPVEVRSGYNGNALGAYMELRDERVSFFVRALARGKHSVSYRLRAEIPGSFSALPTKASAMYAPELKANSDEMKLRIVD